MKRWVYIKLQVYMVKYKKKSYYAFQITKVFLNHSTVWSSASSRAFFRSGTSRLARMAKP